MNNAKWHGPAKNPLAVALEVAQVYGCSGRLYATISAIARWEIFDEKDFIEDLLQEIAGATDIVVQYRTDGWYACMDTQSPKPADLPPCGNPAIRYYALLDTGELAYVGQFASIDRAFDHDPPGTVWMVDDSDVSQWLSTVQSARDDTLPPIVATSEPPTQLSE